MIKKTLITILLYIFVTQFTYAATTQSECYNFDGTNDYVTFPNPVSYLPAGDASRTISCWIESGTNAGEKPFLSYGLDATNQAFALTTLSSRPYALSLWGYSNDHTGFVPLGIGNTYHLAVVYDSAASTLKTYVNGILDVDNSAVTNFNTGTSYFYFSNTPALGKGINKLWDVKIYDSALSEAKVKGLMGYTINLTLDDTVTVPASSNWGISASNGFVYITSYGGSSVIQIDPTDNSLDNTYNNGGAVSDVLWDGDYVVIANYGGNTVKRLTASLSFVDQLAGFTGPVGLEFDGTDYWVSNRTNNTISKVNKSSFTITDTVTGTGANPEDLLLHNDALWALCLGDTVINKVNTTTAAVESSITGLNGPGQIAVVGSNFWVTNYSNNTLAKIDIASETVTKTYNGFLSPWGLCYTGSYLWVNGENSSMLLIVDPNTGFIVSGSRNYDTHGPIVCAEDKAFVGSQTTDLFVFDDISYQSYDCSGISDTPVFEALCNEGSGTTTIDTISGNNGTITTDDVGTFHSTVEYVFTCLANAAKQYFGIGNKERLLKYLSK